MAHRVGSRRRRIAALSSFAQGLGWRGAGRRFGEERGDRDLQSRRQAIEKIDRRVSLLSLKLAHPRPVDARVSGETLL